MATDDHDPVPYPRPAYAWYVVGVLVLFYTFSFIDRQILALLVKPIRQDLQINDTEMSLLLGLSFAILYTVMGLPIGRMVDTGSRRGVIAAGVVTWSLMTAACGLARQYWQLFAARVGVGVGEAALSPAAYSLITDYFRKERMGLAFGVYAIGIFIGAGLAMIIGGIVIKLLAVGSGTLVLPLLGEMHGWQVVFLVVGLPGLPLSLLMLTVREPVRRAMSGATAEGKPPVGVVAAYIRANLRCFLCYSLGFGLLSLTSYAAGAWVPTFFVRTYGWTAGDAGIRFGEVALVFGSLGVVGGGWLADQLARLGHRDGKLKVGLVAALGGLIPAMTFPLMSSPWAALAMLALTTLFATSGFGIGPAGIQEMMPNRMRGLASAVYLFIINMVGLGLGPTSVALITDYVFHDDAMMRYSLGIAAAGGLAGATVMFLLSRAPYRRSLDRLVAWQASTAAAAD